MNTTTPGKPGTADTAPKPDRTPPIKDPNPPDAQVDHPAPETPKVGSRDAPGG